MTPDTRYILYLMMFLGGLWAKSRSDGDAKTDAIGGSGDDRFKGGCC